MTAQQPEALLLADRYAAAHAKWALEDLYGSSKTYTAEKLVERHAARATLERILRTQQPESPTPPAEQQATPKAAPQQEAQADSQPVPAVDKCTKQQMTAEVLRRMQQQEDGHNKNPFRSLLDRLMRNEGGYSTIEIGQLKYALDGFYGAAYAMPQQEAQKPYAYAVYFPDQPTVELVHDLDELTDDLTNREHQITELYAAPQAKTPAQGDAEDAARYRWLREGNDAKHGAAWHVAVNLYGCEWDAAIDAAMKAGGAA